MAGGGSLVDVLEDAIANPISDAKAADPPQLPDIADEPCNVSVPAPPPTGARIFAVHAYPGKKATELAFVRTIARKSPAPAALTIAGLPYEGANERAVLVRDGSAAVFCGFEGDVSYDKVTFILSAP